MSETCTTARPRRLIIHAVTHKTGSTEIQRRLRRSESLLSQQGIVDSYPEEDTWNFKQLTKAMSRDCCSPWHSYFQSQSHIESDLLIGTKLDENGMIRDGHREDWEGRRSLRDPAGLLALPPQRIQRRRRRAADSGCRPADLPPHARHCFQQQGPG